MRILFLGDNWIGSSARSWAEALRRKGCDLIEVGNEEFLTPHSSWWLRGARRAAAPLIVRDYNRRIQEIVHRLRPEVLLAFKGEYLEPESLHEARREGTLLVNYFPDVLVRTSRLRATLPLYDMVFHAHALWGAREAVQLGIREAAFVPFGYDPELHRPKRLEARDVEEFRCDVSFAGTYTPYKERVLDRLLELSPDLEINVRGNSWGLCRAPRVQGFLRGPSLTGDLYAKMIAAADINLAILAGYEGPGGTRDETTMRTFEIPAVGAFSLHERTEELALFFEEDREVACFGTVEELAEKIERFLSDPEARRSIAAAGSARCVPAYSYDSRVDAVLSWIEAARS